MGISEQSTLLCEQKLLTSRQIFRYAVPARTVTKKALILSFLTGRAKMGSSGHLVKALKVIDINLSVVQVSGFGPSLHIIMESDLHPKYRDNKLMKYADDTNLFLRDNKLHSV